MTQPPNTYPWRSVLYMPGTNSRAQEKARTLPADAIILDLEDSVSPTAKEQAREQIRTSLLTGYPDHRVLVRCNDLNALWGFADLVALASLPLDGIILPKVASPRDLDQALTVLRTHNPACRIPLWAMIETPRGVLKLPDIAGHHAIAGLVAGTSDLASDLHARHTPERTPFLYALSRIVCAARAFKLVALDGVHLDLTDDAGFEQTCLQGRDLGFDGKTLIHPKTIATANRVFSPQPETVATSRRIVAAFEEASARGEGLIILDGRLLEHLHVAEARRILGLHDAITRRDTNLP